MDECISGYVERWGSIMLIIYTVKRLVFLRESQGSKP